MRYIITRNGSYSIQTIYGPGNIYPLTLIFQAMFDMEIYAGPEIVYYEALCESELYFLDKEALLTKVEADPLYYRDLLEEAGKRFYSNIHMLENVSLKNSTQRLAHELAYCAELFGKRLDDTEVQILVPLTHAILSNILSLTRETVSQAIGELRTEQLIQTLPHKSFVVNLEKLKAFAYGQRAAS